MVRELGGGVRENEEGDISREEIRAVIRKQIDSKAVRMDKIPAEVWKYGGAKVEEWVWKTCNRIWRGKEWIEDWSDSSDC